ncbi:sodium/hydrogen exchanger [Methanolobus psychrophilus R15]|nr:sodium/hydrogen exchanger [Methanolobus psychrophilus R15]
MVGIIIVGALIGPNALNILERNDTIILLGEIGLVYLMFIAGLEININKFIEKLDRSLVFGMLSFLIPQIAGTLVGYYLLDLSFPAALLFASVFASHTLLAYPVIKKLGIVNNEAIAAAVGGTILTDTLALMVLAIVVSSMEGNLDMSFWIQLAAGLGLFFAGSWLIVPRIARWFFSKLTEESYFEFLFVLAVAFVIAYLAEVAGVEPIIGAFFAGLLLNRLIPNSSPLMNRIEFVGNALFIPFFLLSVGMLVNAGAFLEGGSQLTLALWLIGLVLITKLAAAWITGRVYGYGNDQVMSMFGLSVGQAAAALAIVLIGFEAGLFGHDMINAVVMMILVISIISPNIVERYGGRVSLAEQATYGPAESAPRVLVSFSIHSTYKQLLLDLALMIRDHKSDEPLHVISVVKRNNDNSKKNVAEAERMLRETTAYAACAEVPVLTHVRLNYNIASGIMKAVLENRISTIVMGWDGAHAPKESVIGSIIDQLLRGTEKLVLVSLIRHPLCNTKGITLIIPPGIDHNAGFYSVVDAVGRISEGTAAPVKALVVRDEAVIYEKVCKRVIPDIPIRFESLGSWSDLINMLHSKEWSRDELIITANARRDTPGWHPVLQTLPKRISSFFEGNLLMAYPPTEEQADEMEFF